MADAGETDPLDPTTRDPLTTTPPAAPQPASKPGLSDADLVKRFDDMGKQDRETLTRRQAEMAPASEAVRDAARAEVTQGREALDTLKKNTKSVGEFKSPDIKEQAWQWMAVASALGALAGSRSRYHTTAAMNAFAGMTQGYAQGSMKMFDQKYKEWQSSVEAANKNNETVHREYMAVMDNAKLNLEQKMTEVKLIASKYQDELAFNAANQQNFTQLAQLLDKRAALQTTAQYHQDQIQVQREKMDAAIKTKLASSGQMINEAGEVVLDLNSPKGKQINDLTDGVESGKLPPTLKGLYGAAAPVQAQLSSRGFNLSQAQNEWTESQKQIQSLNGPQMTRYVGLAKSVVSTIDEVKDLSRQMELSGIPLLNKLELERYMQTQGNSEKGQLAARYIGAVTTLKEEFANLAQGGYAPTQAAFALADKQINENYGVKQMEASLTEVQRLINYRLQNVPNLATMGPGVPNRYQPQGAAPPPEAPAAAPAVGGAAPGAGGGGFGPITRVSP